MRPDSLVGVRPGGSRVGAGPAITPPPCGRDRRLLLEQFRWAACRHWQAADRMRCNLGLAARADDGHREAVGQV